MARLELPSSIAEAGSPPGSNRAYLHSAAIEDRAPIIICPFTAIAVGSLVVWMMSYPVGQSFPIC